MSTISMNLPDEIYDILQKIHRITGESMTKIVGSFIKAAYDEGKLASTYVALVDSRIADMQELKAKLLKIDEKEEE